VATHQVEAADVFPKRYSVSRAGAMCSLVRFSFSSTASSTPRPPVCSRKWSKAFVKSGVYDRLRAALTYADKMVCPVKTLSS
jgi:hypothetical protein